MLYLFYFTNISNSHFEIFFLAKSLNLARVNKKEKGYHKEILQAFFLAIIAKFG
jgi:hypothetical protein